MALPVTKEDLRRQFEIELTGNILPFWMTHVTDEASGGLHGAVAADLSVDDDVPRSSVLCARVLWTFSAAYRALGDRSYLAMASRTFEDLVGAFWDPEHGGLYWEVDRDGAPVADRKHHYAQAFGIYGLSEYHRATGDERSLDLARRIFEKLEAHAFDPALGGYFEGSSRDWERLDDPRLSSEDVDAPKSMNTMLHILEAYTNLLRAWDHARLKVQLRGLIEAFLSRILDPETSHFGTFFDDAWRPMADAVSYGHDIEASWLLCRAAQVIGDSPLRRTVESFSVAVAGAVLNEGLDDDGSLFTESVARGDQRRGKDWWTQAEAIVGLYNAFQLTGDSRFFDATRRCWENVRNRFVDPAGGDWFKRLTPDGTPDPSSPKAGPWECPYHHARACLEMMDRLGEQD